MSRMFGHYRLDARIGTGGGGEVWRAFDTTLKGVVAIKMLLPGFDDDPDSAARFHREAQLAAGLRHPNIVRVHNFGQIDRRLFIDMELVQGVSLAEAAAAGPLELERAMQIVGSLAKALNAAHALDGPTNERLMHRDVKPGNVLLENRAQEEHVYLVDFGVARPVEPGASITTAGVLVGTPLYMAPELWDPTLRPDHRIDIYALSVLTFEILTGTLPFPQATLAELCLAHQNSPTPSARPLRGDLPAAVDGVLERGMAKRPVDRYDTARDFADALFGAMQTGQAFESRRPNPGSVRSPVPAAATPPATVPRSELPSTASPGLPAPVPTPIVQPARTPYLGSPPHFAGLACTALLLPLYLAGFVPVGWQLFAVFVLLYGLGAIAVGLLGIGLSAPDRDH